MKGHQSRIASARLENQATTTGTHTGTLPHVHVSGWRWEARVLDRTHADTTRAERRAGSWPVWGINPTIFSPWGDASPQSDYIILYASHLCLHLKQAQVDHASRMIALPKEKVVQSAGRCLRAMQRHHRKSQETKWNYDIIIHVHHSSSGEWCEWIMWENWWKAAVAKKHFRHRAKRCCHQFMWNTLHTGSPATAHSMVGLLSFVGFNLICFWNVSRVCICLILVSFWHYNFILIKIL